MSVNNLDSSQNQSVYKKIRSKIEEVTRDRPRGLALHIEDGWLVVDSMPLVDGKAKYQWHMMIESNEDGKVKITRSEDSWSSQDWIKASWEVIVITVTEVARRYNIQVV